MDRTLELMGLIKFAFEKKLIYGSVHSLVQFEYSNFISNFLLHVESRDACR